MTEDPGLRALAERATLRKSSYSNDDAGCLDHGLIPGYHVVADTKEDSRTRVVFPNESWAAFMRTIK